MKTLRTLWNVAACLGRLLVACVLYAAAWCAELFKPRRGGRCVRCGDWGTMRGKLVCSECWEKIAREQTGGACSD